MEIHPRPTSEQMVMMVVLIMVSHSIKTDIPMSVIKRCQLAFDNHDLPFHLETCMTNRLFGFSALISSVALLIFFNGETFAYPKDPM